MIMPFLWVLISSYSQDKIVSNFMKTIGTQPVNLAFENLTVKTIQDTQKSVNLKSPNARIYDLKMSKIDLYKPIIHLFEKDKPDKVLNADMGYYEHDKHNVTLLHNVRLSEGNSYKIKTDKLMVDLNNFTIKLPHGIDALYKNNSLKSDDVEFQQKSNKVIFKGGVKLIIQPKSF